ncbi:uncharacterized protein CTRU02_214370 [Colletotrichum truncatum]|nr:uncharacterized protein CTRU02_13525 [Colletotrichum truncatum]KAF6783289.1 hypothetical protein CTRU02_13525 [Colletotrichum truncatum]
MESPRHENYSALDDSTGRLFEDSFLDENELEQKWTPDVSKHGHTRKRARAGSSSTVLATSDDDCTVPNLPDMPDTPVAYTRQTDFWIERDVVMKATARAGAVTALAQEVVREVAKNY